VSLLEAGDLFFFYRPRVGVAEVAGRDDVQRLFMVMAPEGRRLFRLLVIGRKKLPEVAKGARHPEDRNWVLNALTTSKIEDLRGELEAKRYWTKTRGERFLGAARSAGEARYALIRHGNHTELAVALRLPRTPGPAQDEFRILDQASYIIAVRNPDLGGGPRFPPHL
jgi:hypothetical protein